MVPVEGGLELAPEGAPDAIDWVVEMVRFDEERTMAAAVRRDALRDEDVVATARTIQRFHADAGRPAVSRWSRQVADAWQANIDELADAGGAEVTPARTDAWRRFASGFLHRRGTDLDERASTGRVVDGHGDLRAEHVVLDREGVVVVDRLEFDARLRRVDVADDLAFLVMDLRRLGAARAAEDLVTAYRDAGGDPGDEALVAAFAVHRALVRAKVGFLRAAQLTGAAAEAARRDALRLTDLADALAWRARGRLLLVVSGPPASGKSTLASALASAGDLAVLSSDVVRKEALEVPVGVRAAAESYSPDAKRLVYAELGARASMALRSGSVVVDATFGAPAHRDAFLAGLSQSDRDRLRLIVCEAPLGVRIERAWRRAEAGGDDSDAGPEVVRQLGDDLAEPPAAHRLAVSTDGCAQDLAARVATWIDGSP